MPVITFSSPKGGAGKTTAATLLATELADQDALVCVIDADPNQNVMDWSKLPGRPEHLSVVGGVTEETIMDVIEDTSRTNAFVIVDLEGTASLMASYAISLSDLVIIPVQGSQLDAKQAVRAVKLIKHQERAARRSIPFSVLLTRTSGAIQPKTQKHIESRFAENNVPMLQTRLIDREAFRAIFSFGGTLNGLTEKENQPNDTEAVKKKEKKVSNVDAAKKNAVAFAAEIVTLLKQGGKQNDDNRQVAE